jgi:hypothetical protein
VAPPPAPRPRASLAEGLAALLTLASALCGLAAAGLFVLPAVRGEVGMKPRLLTLTPAFAAPEGGKDAQAKDTAQARAPGKGATGTDPFAQPDDIVREEHADFKGSILMLESEPSGASAFVGGKEQGETPMSVGLDCMPGQPLHVEFVLKGYARAKHDTVCPQDMLLKLTARLKKGGAKRP